MATDRRANTAADAGFLGTGWAFPPAFERGGCAARLVSREQDVRESLFILLSTSPGERVMQPGYGCSLKRLLFGRIDQGTLTELRDAIEQAVLFHEQRITLGPVEIDTSEMAEGLLRIALSYTLRSTNTRQNVVFPFYLQQGTDLRQRA